MAPGQSPADAGRSEAALTQALVRLERGCRGLPGPQGQREFHCAAAGIVVNGRPDVSARRYYNANVKELNTKVESIPTNFIAGPAGVTKAEYFELEMPSSARRPRCRLTRTRVRPL